MITMGFIASVNWVIRSMDSVIETILAEDWSMATSGAEMLEIEIVAVTDAMMQTHVPPNVLSNTNGGTADRIAMGEIIRVFR